MEYIQKTADVPKCCSSFILPCNQNDFYPKIQKYFDVLTVLSLMFWLNAFYDTHKLISMISLWEHYHISFGLNFLLFLFLVQSWCHPYWDDGVIDAKKMKPQYWICNITFTLSPCCITFKMVHFGFPKMKL